MSDCFFAKAIAAASLCPSVFSFEGICGLAYRGRLLAVLTRRDRVQHLEHATMNGFPRRFEQVNRGPQVSGSECHRTLDWRLVFSPHLITCSRALLLCFCPPRAGKNRGDKI